ncbi:putative holin-like toxin [Mammaliicoccus sciuri]|nr:putative holin-like toxin [Mammaliicoccus sciuri]
MCVSTQSIERRRLLVTIEVTIQMMISFGIFILTFIGIVIAIINISQKK